MENNSPIILGREALSNGIYYEKKAYLLSNSDFEILIQGKTNWIGLAYSSFGAFIGLLIKIVVVCVLIVNKENMPLNELESKPDDFTIDLYCAFVFLLASILFFIVDCCTKGAKDKLKKEIRNYFNE